MNNNNILVISGYRKYLDKLVAGEDVSNVFFSVPQERVDYVLDLLKHVITTKHISTIKNDPYTDPTFPEQTTHNNSMWDEPVISINPETLKLLWSLSERNKSLETELRTKNTTQSYVDTLNLILSGKDISLADVNMAVRLVMMFNPCYTEEEARWVVSNWNLKQISLYIKKNGRFPTLEKDYIIV